MGSKESVDRKRVEHAWQELLSRWSEDDAHRQFIALCSATGALAEAGRRYREIQERDPVRSAEAQRRLQAVLVAALHSMDAARPTSPARRSRLFWLVCGALLTLAVSLLLTVLRRLPQ